MNDLLKKAMKKKNLTQIETAKLFGVSQTKISKVLNGRMGHDTTIQIIKKMNSEFKIPFKTILESINK